MARDTLRLPVAVKRFATSTLAKTAGLDDVMPEPAPTPRLGDAGIDFNDATTMFGLPAGYDDDTQLLGMEMQPNDDDDTMVLQQKAFGANQAHLPGVGLGERLFEMLLQPPQQQAPAAGNALEISRTIDLGSSLIGRTPQRRQSRTKPGNLSSAQKRNLRTSTGAGGQTYVDCELDVRFGDDIITEEAEVSLHHEAVDTPKQAKDVSVRKIDWISQIKTFDKKSLSVVKAPEVPQSKQPETDHLPEIQATLETTEDVFQAAFSETYRDTQASASSSPPPPPPTSNRKTPSKAQRKRRQSIMSSSPAHFMEQSVQTAAPTATQHALRRSPRKSQSGSKTFAMPAHTALKAPIAEANIPPVLAVDQEPEVQDATAASHSPAVLIADYPALRRSPRKSTGSRKSLDAVQGAGDRQSGSAPEAVSSRLSQQARKSLPSTRSALTATIAEQNKDVHAETSAKDSLSKRREIRKAKRGQITAGSSVSAEEAAHTPQNHDPSVALRTGAKALQTFAPVRNLSGEEDVPPTGQPDQPDQQELPVSPAKSLASNTEEQASAPIASSRSPFPAFRRLDPLSPVMEDSEREREKEMSMERSLLLQRALAVQAAPRQLEIQALEPAYVNDEDAERDEAHSIGQEQGAQSSRRVLLAAFLSATEERAQSPEAINLSDRQEARNRSVREVSPELERASVHTYTLSIPFPSQPSHPLDSDAVTIEQNRQGSAHPAIVIGAAQHMPDPHIPTATTSQLERPLSRHSERPRSRQSTASSQLKAKGKSKPYERPKPTRTASTATAVPHTTQIVPSTSRPPPNAPAVAPRGPAHTQPPTEQPRGRTRNISVPVNFSPGQKKRPKPNVTRKASVDDMFSRRQRDGSRGRGLETASQPDSTTSSRRARSETARSSTAITLTGSRPVQTHLSVQDKQKKGLLTEPRSFTFSTSASTKRKREHDSQRTASRSQNGTLAKAVPRTTTALILTASAKSIDAMASRCQEDTEAQEDERVVPLTQQALQAHEILEISIGEVELPDQSLSAAEHNKTARSQTVLRYLRQLADIHSDIEQLEGRSNHSDDNAAEHAEGEHLPTTASEQQEQMQSQTYSAAVEEQAEEADIIELRAAPARAKRARLDVRQDPAEQSLTSRNTLATKSRHVLPAERPRLIAQPVQGARTSPQKQRQRTRKSPRKAGVAVTEPTTRHPPPALKAHPTEPRPFTFMSVGKEQASFQVRLRTWQEREETAAKNGKRVLQPLATGLGNIEQSQASRKNTVRHQKQSLEVRPFAFPSDKRMEERREWEERLRAKERIKAELAAIERAEAEAREAAEIKEMRRNQIIRANPLPAYITDRRTVR